MTPDMAKIRREHLRWLILLTLNNARPYIFHEAGIVSTTQGVYADATPLEIRRELDYLDERSLIALRKEANGEWFAELTRHGVDVVEYTVDCDPGIARPSPKYW